MANMANKAFCFKMMKFQNCFKIYIFDLRLYLKLYFCCSLCEMMSTERKET
uniref:Uncharacterized protein n=1 Tax=Anguilla anguilla TaxID=7936 RepID=A0A0E9WHX7_ANGAN